MFFNKFFKIYTLSIFYLLGAFCVCLVDMCKWSSLNLTPDSQNTAGSLRKGEGGGQILFCLRVLSGPDTMTNLI